VSGRLIVAFIVVALLRSALTLYSCHSPSASPVTPGNLSSLGAYYP